MTEEQKREEEQKARMEKVLKVAEDAVKLKNIPLPDSLVRRVQEIQRENNQKDQK